MTITGDRPRTGARSALGHPFSNRLLPLGFGEWAICIGLVSLVLWADEASKLILRRVEARG